MPDGCDFGEMFSQSGNELGCDLGEMFSQSGIELGCDLGEMLSQSGNESSKISMRRGRA